MGQIILLEFLVPAQEFLLAKSNWIFKRKALNVISSSQKLPNGKHSNGRSNGTAGWVLAVKMNYYIIFFGKTPNKKKKKKVRLFLFFFTFKFYNMSEKIEKKLSEVDAALTKPTEGHFSMVR